MRVDETNPPAPVLLIAEAANPEWTSVPLEGWAHGRAIQRATPAHLVTQIRNGAAFERAMVPVADYTTIDSEAITRPLYKLGERLRGGSNRGWTTVTALQALGYPYFEHLLWKRFEQSLRQGEFSLVHRLTPLSPTMPSRIAQRLKKLDIPFVLGPLNGGIPWPRQFDSTRRREREWLSYVRGAYKLLPGYRSTRKHAAAIICGSQATLEQMPAWSRDRCVYIPENAIDPANFPEPTPKSESKPLRVAFIGRLVPYKGADMLIEAAAPLIRDKRVELDIIGDGPEGEALRALVRQHDLAAGVSFAGWVPHNQLHERLARSHMFGFPSVREFGGAVVLESMALGLVPLVLDYGGPGELVTRETGFVVPIGTRAEVIDRFRTVLTQLAAEPAQLTPMRAAGRARALSLFTWDAKAQQVLSVYRWVLGQGPKPEPFGAAMEAEREKR